MDWIQSEFVCCYSQLECDCPSKIMLQSAGEVKQDWMLVSWQAIYRKWSGLFSVIYVVATSTADYLSNSLHLQELGVTTKHPTYCTKTCISQGTLPVTKICCINRNTTQRFQIYLSVTFTPDFVWALNLKAKLEWWSHLCSETLNIIDFAL